MSLSALMNKALALQMHSMVHPAGHSTMCPEGVLPPMQLNMCAGRSTAFPYDNWLFSSTLAGLGVPSHGLDTHAYTGACVCFCALMAAYAPCNCAERTQGGAKPSRASSIYHITHDVHRSRKFASCHLPDTEMSSQPCSCRTGTGFLEGSLCLNCLACPDWQGTKTASQLPGILPLKSYVPPMIF